jgi:PAS domain S-box-containing protein
VEWYQILKEAKIDIKDFLAIIVSLFAIWAGYKVNVHKYVMYAWRKIMMPIFDKISGRAATNARLDNLTTLMTSGIAGIKILTSDVEKLKSQHETMIKEFNPNNGGQSMKEMTTMTHALILTMIDKNEEEMILMTNPKGEVLRANRLFRSTTERDQSEIKGSGWINCIAESDRSRVWKDFNDAIMAERDYESTYYIVDKKGTEYHVSSKATRLTDPKGNIIGYHRTLKFID